MARRTRDAVLAAFASLEGFVSAQELHLEIQRQGGSVGLTTVYRDLRRLHDEHQVDFVRDGDGEGRYRYCGSGHHHHLICTVCGAITEVRGDELERWVASVATASGYRAVHHTVELLGICATCPLP